MLRMHMVLGFSCKVHPSRSQLQFWILRWQSLWIAIIYWMRQFPIQSNSSAKIVCGLGGAHVKTTYLHNNIAKPQSRPSSLRSESWRRNSSQANSKLPSAQCFVHYRNRTERSAHWSIRDEDRMQVTTHWYILERKLWYLDFKLFQVSTFSSTTFLSSLWNLLVPNLR